MKIAFFGSSILSAFRNGAATYFRGVIRGLHALGYRTTFYEFDDPTRRDQRDLQGSLDWVTVALYGDAPGSVEHAVESARDADVIIKTDTTGPFDASIEREILAGRRPNQTLIFWDVNAAATLARIADRRDELRAGIMKFDVVFTNGGGDGVTCQYKSFGARDCVTIHNAVDPSVHHPVAAREDFRADLAFMANRRSDIDSRFDEFFARPAEMISGARFLLAGDGWNAEALPKSIRALGHIRTADHNSFHSSPRAVLCIAGDFATAHGWTPPARLFEAGGAAACLISDPWDGLESLLDPGHEILVARDGDEVAEILRTLEPQTARMIGKAALRRLLAQHTFSHRATQIDAILTGRSRGNRAVANVLSSAR